MGIWPGGKDIVRNYIVSKANKIARSQSGPPFQYEFQESLGKIHALASLQGCLYIASFSTLQSCMYSHKGRLEMVSDLVSKKGSPKFGHLDSL